MNILDYVEFGLAIIFIIAMCVVWMFHFIALVFSKYKLHKKPKRFIERDQLPGVSIIKPLIGTDDNLSSNLETFFTMKYPVYELLFCWEDLNDPSIPVVNALIERYPNISAKMFKGGKEVGINPKINNMIQGYEAASYDLILISDAGLIMGEDTLYDMVLNMTDKVGLVHQLPFACDRPGFAGTLEKVYFGTCQARLYLFINFIGINCVTGMSCLMRKNVMDQLGGLQRFGVYIAEDFFIAKAYTDNNWKICLSSQPAMQNSATYSVPIWQKRMIRWCKLRLRINIGSWLEPIADCFLLGLCASWAVNFFFGWNSLVFFLIHVLAWFLSDYMLLKTCQAGKLPFTKYEYIIAWLYRESICFYLFVKAASNPNVKWREGKYKLKWGSRAEKIEDNKTTVKAKSTSLTALNIESGNIELSNSSSTNVNNGNLSNPTPTITTSTFSLSASPELTHSLSAKHKNHKRTNSYSVIHKSNQNINSNSSNYSNSDMESNSYTPFLSSNKTTITTTQKAPFNYVRTHQHHHSISSPFVFNNNHAAQIITTAPMTTTAATITTTNNTNSNITNVITTEIPSSKFC